jgi:hypothetical protein
VKAEVRSARQAASNQGQEVIPLWYLSAKAGFTNHLHPAILPVIEVDFILRKCAISLRKIERLRLIPREQVSEGLFSPRCGTLL